ncbi:ABC transporter permease [Mesorhizobium sp. CA8]|uniref:ABC transporter permease n=1 Tax=unclassified Mesorhizobium TaxID=325217 RepID=UPI001CC98E9A|nr:MULTISPECIES: ABC transporter permease [unclassified Mesorhizobium]MBZ9761664.1 ABC transporter permease [Mesorhizobium sp. CA8]MBZ9820582.1 ABC transporter permease [Mesorhizobium sp. CA4]
MKKILAAPFRLLAAMDWPARIGALIVLIYVIVAVFAPLLAPFGEAEVVGSQYDPWTSVHLLGTDNIGRDMLSRVIYGARNTIAIAIIATILAFLVGCSFGFTAAVIGGKVDVVISRVNDLFMAIPLLIFALMLLTVFGSSIAVLIIIIALLESTRVYRVARALAMNVVVADFVEQAKLRGEGLWWIATREILPNTIPPLTAEFGLRFCFVFLFISAMSFLGLGIQPPTADWGAMVRDNATLIGFGDITPLIPAGAIAVLTVAVNLVVDWFLHRASGLKEV